MVTTKTRRRIVKGIDELEMWPVQHNAESEAEIDKEVAYLKAQYNSPIYIDDDEI